MAEKYYVLYPGEDGMTVCELTKEQLERRLAEEYYGRREFLDHVPEGDHNYWGPTILILKGEVVVPKVVKVVEKYEV